MENIKLSIIFLLTVFISLPVTSYSHSGRTDSSGCHTNRKTGDYHCHNSGGGSYNSRGDYKRSYGGSSGGGNRGSGLTIIMAEPPKPARPPLPQQKSASASRQKSGPAKKQQAVKSIKVVGVSDGDTLKVIMDKKQGTIRLYGIDAPENMQAFGQISTQTLMKMTSGRAITLRTMGKDKHGRVIALVYGDGACLNEALVRSGYAWVYPQYCKESFCESWVQHEAVARKVKKGLWQDDAPVSPWQWREKYKESKGVRVTEGAL